MAKEKLGPTLRKAREDRGMTLRQVERETGINNAHVSQVENGIIRRPDLALLYALASAYDIDYRHLLALAGAETGEGSERERQRMSTAIQAMGELSPKDQTEVLAFIAELRQRG
jgi:transcriptional regulator with XRE-family HTH domain